MKRTTTRATELRLKRVKIRRLARQILDQPHLNSLLLQIPNRLVRREVYELWKPHLRFESDYPKEVAEPHRR